MPDFASSCQITRYDCHVTEGYFLAASKMTHLLGCPGVKFRFSTLHSLVLKLTTIDTHNDLNQMHAGHRSQTVRTWWRIDIVHYTANRGDFGHGLTLLSVMSLLQPRGILIILLVTHHSSQQEAKRLNMPHLSSSVASRQECLLMDENDVLALGDTIIPHYTPHPRHPSLSLLI